MVTMADETKKVIVAERGELLFVFNFHVSADYEGLEVGVGTPGKWRVAADSDSFDAGGLGRVGWDVDHFTSPGGPKCWIGPHAAEARPCSLRVLSPARTVQVRSPPRFPIVGALREGDRKMERRSFVAPLHGCKKGVTKVRDRTNAAPFLHFHAKKGVREGAGGRRCPAGRAAGPSRGAAPAAGPCAAAGGGGRGQDGGGLPHAHCAILPALN